MGWTRAIRQGWGERSLTLRTLVITRRAMESLQRVWGPRGRGPVLWSDSHFETIILATKWRMDWKEARADVGREGGSGVTNSLFSLKGRAYSTVSLGFSFLNYKMGIITLTPLGMAGRIKWDRVWHSPYYVIGIQYMAATKATNMLEML